MSRLPTSLVNEINAKKVLEAKIQAFLKGEKGDKARDGKAISDGKTQNFLDEEGIRYPDIVRDWDQGQKRGV